MATHDTTPPAHTPGPWTYDRLDQHEPTDIAAYRIDSTVGWDNVADVFEQREPGRAEANARLIAAAPVLLAACRGAHALLHADREPQARAILDAAIETAAGPGT